MDSGCVENHMPNLAVPSLVQYAVAAATSTVRQAQAAAARSLCDSTLLVVDVLVDNKEYV